MGISVFDCRRWARLVHNFEYVDYNRADATYMDVVVAPVVVGGDVFAARCVCHLMTCAVKF